MLFPAHKKKRRLKVTLFLKQYLKETISAGGKSKSIFKFGDTTELFFLLPVLFC